MAKQGQHHGDARDSDMIRGHNNPSKSVTITTGTYKKKETYRKQALAHENPAAPAQAAKNDWIADTHVTKPPEQRTRARHPRSGRSGSDSNTSSGTRGF